MDFTIRLHGGPLDGSAFHGKEDKPPDDWMDLGAKAFQDTNRAELGATFETLNPDSLGSVSSYREDLQLHVYRIVGKRLVQYKSAGDKQPREKIVSDADYVGPSANRLPPITTPPVG